MKRTILAATCVAFAALMVSCGSKGDKKDKAAEAEEIVEKAAKMPENKKSLEAAGYYLDVIGVKLDDIKPDFEYEMDEAKCCYGEERATTIIFKKPVGQTLTKEEGYAWLRKVYEATKKASPKGVVKGFHDSNESGTKEEAMQPAPNDIEAMIAESGKFIVYMWGWTTLAGDTFIKISPDFVEGDGADNQAYVKFYAYNDMQQSWKDTKKMVEEHADEIEKALK